MIKQNINEPEDTRIEGRLKEVQIFEDRLNAEFPEWSQVLKEQFTPLSKGWMDYVYSLNNKIKELEGNG